MNEVQDLRERREALQTELGSLREQQERASRANSYALSRQRAGVTHLDESEMKELADDEVARGPAIAEVRREIELIDSELLARDHGGPLNGTGRRVLGWLRK
jgi:hypothetical protein